MISHTAVRYLQLVLGALGLAALLGSSVALCYVYNVRFDLSSGDRFTLSDHAHRVLEAVDRPVKVTAFIRTEDPRNPIIKDLLWQVRREQPLVSYNVVDINRNPSLSAEYGVDAYGATVVESGDKRADFTNPTEQQLTGAILSVLQKPKKVYFLDGHGECSIDNTDRKIGCSLAKQALGLESYDVAKLQLFGGAQVPEDADVVIVLGAESDLLADELASLESWLDRGGDLLVLLDPYKVQRLVGLLGLYGVDVGACVVVEPEHRLAGGEEFSAVITDINRGHLISSTLEAPPLFSLATTVGGRDDEEAGRKITRLLKTGRASWASFDPSAAEGGAVRFVAGRDLNGPLTVGVEATQPARASKVGEDATTRIVVFGDSDFATNRFLDYLGNKDLFVNAVNWLAREDRLISVRPQKKLTAKNQFFISQKDGDSVFRAAVVVQPLLFLFVAVALFTWRRLRP
jgi:ABC-type uncharacterized transport system involved in gliding motility auxiliary subunit